MNEKNEGRIVKVDAQITTGEEMKMSMVIECGPYSYLTMVDVPKKPDSQWALQQTEIIGQELIKNLDYIDPNHFVPELLSYAHKARKLSKLNLVQLH